MAKRSKKKNRRISKGGNITQNGGINIADLLKHPVLNALIFLHSAQYYLLLYEF